MTTAPAVSAVPSQLRDTADQYERRARSIDELLGSMSSTPIPAMPTWLEGEARWRLDQAVSRLREIQTRLRGDAGALGRTARLFEEADRQMNLGAADGPLRSALITLDQHAVLALLVTDARLDLGGIGTMIAGAAQLVQGFLKRPDPSSSSAQLPSASKSGTAVAADEESELKAPVSGGLRGDAWLGGRGVEVYPKGIEDFDSYSSVVIQGERIYVGEKGECVELAQRLYTIRGWYKGAFPVRHAYEIFGKATEMGMAAHKNGSGYVPVPGDLVVVDRGTGHFPNGVVVDYPDGHVSVVNQVFPDHIEVAEQNTASVVGAYDWKGSTASRLGWPEVIGFVHHGPLTSDLVPDLSPPISAAPSASPTSP